MKAINLIPYHKIKTNGRSEVV